MLMAPTEDSYSYNQAIMELGALICIPKQPKCLICPVSSCCDAFANGTQAMLPVKAAKKATPHFTIGVGVIRNAEGKVLIQQRPEEGLLGGLWEFPGGKQEANESLPETVRREIAEELGIQVNVGEPITQVKHAYSHFKITLHAYWCEYVSGQPESRASQGWKWVTLDELSQYAFPKANNRILDVILNA
jgi:A/G-specific adenine glycosylase